MAPPNAARPAPLPLIVTARPLASSTVSAAIVIVLLSVIVPSQSKVTVPPPARALSKWAWSQSATVFEAAGAADGSQAKAIINGKTTFSFGTHADAQGHVGLNKMLGILRSS